MLIGIDTGQPDYAALVLSDHEGVKGMASVVRELPRGIAQSRTFRIPGRPITGYTLDNGQRAVTAEGVRLLLAGPLETDHPELLALVNWLEGNDLD